MNLYKDKPGLPVRLWTLQYERFGGDSAFYWQESFGLFRDQAFRAWTTTSRSSWDTQMSPLPLPPLSPPHFHLLFVSSMLRLQKPEFSTAPRTSTSDVHFSFLFLCVCVCVCVCRVMQKSVAGEVAMDRRVPRVERDCSWALTVVEGSAED